MRLEFLSLQWQPLKCNVFSVVGFVIINWCTVIKCCWFLVPTGGKVIARHEEKAHHFLFPTEQQEDKPREVVMSKGRRFEVGYF